MQYLLKVQLPHTPLWRLLAIDGIADRAFVAQLIALGFGYPPAARSFIIEGREYPAGCGGEALDSTELLAFDAFALQEGGTFGYCHDRAGPALHEGLVLKAASRLYCLLPSCLVGSGYVPEELEISAEAVTAFLDRDDCPSLDLRVATRRMRSYGLRRSDAHQALISAGAAPLHFKLQ